MDSLDYQILEKLKSNARQRASEISREVHLSVSTVIDRIHKMEAAGIIKSYTIITDDAKVGNDVTVLIEVSMEHPQFNDTFIENVTGNPYVISYVNLSLVEHRPFNNRILLNTTYVINIMYTKQYPGGKYYGI